MKRMPCIYGFIIDPPKIAGNILCRRGKRFSKLPGQQKKKEKLMDIELLLLRFLRLLLASLLCHGTHLLSSELYQ